MHEQDHTERDNIENYFSGGTYLAPTVLWTGHITNGNKPSVTSGWVKVIITPNSVTEGTDYHNKSTQQARYSAIKTLFHEISHTLGARDQYCKGKNSDKNLCSNTYCVDCYNHTIDNQQCIMWKNLLSSIEAIATNDVHSVYCSDCISRIQYFISTH